MKKHPNILLGLLLAVTLAIGAVQGRRVERMRESEQFYRWLLAAATQSRFWSELSVDSGDKDAPEMMDEKLFDSACDAAETILPDRELTEEDYDSSGEPYRKLVLMARDEGQDKALYDLADGPGLAKQRENFFRYLREKRLLSVASEFDAEAVYSQRVGVSLGNIFFGFRKLAANFVWLQVDKYWHSGFTQRMLPLMKTSVALDPNFVDAFLLGAWHLSYNQTAKMIDTPWPLRKYNERFGAWVGPKEIFYYQAIDFLKDGIRKNPRNYKLFFDLGYGIYDLKMKDYANAVLYLSEAIRRRHDQWVPRMLFHAMTSNEQYEDALAGWRDYLEKNPGDEKANRFILKNTGMIQERAAQELIDKAAQESDTTKAAALRTEAAEIRKQALQTWVKMAGPGGEHSPFAVGRIMRMKALTMIENGDYLEAIAILENARWKSNDFWEEASRLMIECKQKAGLPLSTSEKKAVIRDQEAEKYKNAPPPAKAS